MPTTPFELAGLTFNGVSVVSRVGKDAAGNLTWLCQCPCGNEFVAVGYRVKSGTTKSCGCLNARRLFERNYKHGLCYTPTYFIWQGIKRRCFNERHQAFADYGGRGITMFGEWVNSFEAFLRDVGERPPGMEIDRYPNNNGNYEPGNVRWATRKEQSRNTRRNRMLTFRGETKPLRQWCEELGLRYATTQGRLDAGWGVEEAFTAPWHRRHKKQLIVHAGKALSIAEWGRELGMSRFTIDARIRRGWPIERALTERPQAAVK